MVGSDKKLFHISRKSGSVWYMDRQSSSHGVFVRVKTHMGLKQFEVGKSRPWWKNCSFAPGQEWCAIKNYFGTIEGLAIGFNCVEGILLNQNSCGYTTIYGPFLAYFFVNWPRRQSKKNCFRYNWRPTHRLQQCQRDLDGSKLIWE